MNFSFGRSKVSAASGKAGRVFGIIFCSLFLLVGAFFVCWGIRDYLAENALAQRAFSVPCKVISAEVERHHGSNGKLTYSPKIVYEYKINGKVFRGNVIYFSGSVSTNNYSEQWGKLRELKTRKNCWVDPQNLSVASLEKPTEGFLWRKVFKIVFGAIFMLVPSIMIGFLIFSLVKKTDAGTLETGNADFEKSSGGNEKNPLVYLIFSILWLIAPLVMLYLLLFKSGMADWWFPRMFLGVIIFTGLVNFGVAAYKFRKHIRDKNRGVPL